MKRRVFVYFLVLLFPGLLMAQVEKLFPGMTAENFRKVWPGVLPDQVDYNSDLEENVRLNGSDGKLQYHFSKNLLSSMNYNSSEGSSTNRSEEEFRKVATDIFQKYLIAAQKTVEELTLLYGKPATHTEENIADYQPVKNRNSTHFINATWISNGKESVRLSYYFSGIPTVMHANEPGVYPLTYNLSVYYESPCDKTNWPLHPGMTARECADKKPALFPNGVNVNGSFSKTEKINGINGTWSFCFINGVLHHAAYNFRLDDAQDNSKVNEKAFKNCYDAVLKIQHKYESLMGVADFKDIRPKNYTETLKSGKPSIAASWKKDMQIDLEFEAHDSSHKMLTRSMSFEILIYNPAESRPYQCPN